jgi:hypothetical protein
MAHPRRIHAPARSLPTIPISLPTHTRYQKESAATIFFTGVCTLHPRSPHVHRQGPRRRERGREASRPEPPLLHVHPVFATCIQAKSITLESRALRLQPACSRLIACMRARLAYACPISKTVRNCLVQKDYENSAAFARCQALPLYPQPRRAIHTDPRLLHPELDHLQ